MKYLLILLALLLTTALIAQDRQPPEDSTKNIRLNPALIKTFPKTVQQEIDVEKGIVLSSIYSDFHPDYAKLYIKHGAHLAPFKVSNVSYTFDFSKENQAMLYRIRLDGSCKLNDFMGKHVIIVFETNDLARFEAAKKVIAESKNVVTYFYVFTYDFKPDTLVFYPTSLTQMPLGLWE